RQAGVRTPSRPPIAWNRRIARRTTADISSYRLIMQVRRFSRLRRSILASDKGFTLVELLVTSFLGLIMLALTLSATTSNRRLYKYDLVRTRINQNMRSALDIMGIDVRQAGENLFSTF